MHTEVDYQALCTAWGVELPSDLLDHALSHRSWANEEEKPSNERLEFLGDAILGFITVEEIFATFPAETEGQMSKYKAASVSEAALTEIALQLDLGKYLKLSKGEEGTGGREKPSLLSDAVEALIAVTYLSHGLAKTKEVVLAHIRPQIEQAVAKGPALDWRTAFEELARKTGMVGELSYQITGSGPDHARLYQVEVSFAGVACGIGQGSSQKSAKLAACKDAYEKLLASESC